MKSIIGREAATVLITLALLALPLAVVGVYVYQKYQWAEKRLNEVEPRYARLLGLDTNRDALAQAHTKGQALIAQYVYSQEQDSDMS